ncbi:MAG: class I fructose-bisphosphate aldolase [Dehalococcoidia bacterium]
MNADDLTATALAMVASGKGILAVDESVGTCTKRFEAAGIESTPESRGAYREMLFTAPGLGDYVSGAILYDETIRQQTEVGTPLVNVLNAAGIIPGIKVDAGTKPLALAPGETVTEGLDGLRGRLEEYRVMGARFAKWRAVIRIGAGLPSRNGIEVNAHSLARYAALAQEAGLVPIVEPEVLMDGDHGIKRCEEVTSEVLGCVFEQLAAQRCLLEGMVLKPNMITAGSAASAPADADEIAERTLDTLRRGVPSVVPGIAFLSGGQSGEGACANLNAMVRLGEVPWELTFSFGRALQYPALEIWSGDAANAPAAQAALLHRARMSSLARCGEYSAEAERSAPAT